ncbi:MAG: shikimate dehydrogenase [Pseudomonadota bacterium]
MTLRFAVIGDPIAQSLSPTIHNAFARQFGIDLSYQRQRVTVEQFDDEVNEFFASGGRGLNVTVPHKARAFEYADLRTDRALNAGAANTLQFLDHDVVLADNTDGAGLIADLRFHGVSLLNKRVLLLGAGGAARGSLGAILAEMPSAVFIHNRTVSRAETLIERVARLGDVRLIDSVTAAAEPMDVIINATSASLHGHQPDIDPAWLRDAVCYDMMYGDAAQPFLKWALAQGAHAAHDGLGMLIEQAAEAFWVWHEVRPDTASVRDTLMASQPRRR